MPSATRRVVILGASNITLSFAAILEAARSAWDEPMEIMAAMGHGRSFGQESSVLGRKISGIFPCALWQDLQNRKPLPTVAVVSDVGNDILYGVRPEQLLEWVAGCLDRLAAAGAETSITQLPLGSLARLGETRFRFFRTMLFPRSRLSLAEALATAERVNQGLIELGRSRKMPVISVLDAWYGFDPIHLRRSVRRRAWGQMLSHWRPPGALPTAARLGVWERAYLALLAPHEQSFFGVRRRAAQPNGQLNDGTTISLF